jgi:integrase
MSMTVDSTASLKPAKPYPEFPLYAHASGRWAKKIRGKTCFFGPWSDPHAALKRYLAEKDDLEAGRRPVVVAADALTVKEMVDAFLNARCLDVESGNLDRRTWKEYEDFGHRMVRVFGGQATVQALGPADFLTLKADLQKTHKSLVSLKGDIRKIKVFFNWAGPGDRGQNLYERPLRFGPGFQSPSTKSIKRQLDKQPLKVFQRKQVRRMLAKAGPRLRAMILLGINCGLGNTDCARLTRKWVSLKTGWLHYPRPKTGVERHCPLWPETIAAIKKVWATRKAPKNPAHDEHLFLTVRGSPFDGTDISHEFRKLADDLGLVCPGFYAFRHTCATIGSRANLQKAIDTIMGDLPPANYMVRSVYDHSQASKKDLQAVVSLVRAWLYPAADATFPSLVVSLPADHPAAV